MDLVFQGIPKPYSLNALKENIGLLKLSTLAQINALVLEVGRDYLKNMLVRYNTQSLFFLF